MSIDLSYEVVEMNIEDIKPAPYNPRKITKDMLEQLKASIRDDGYLEPIVVNKRTGFVVGGNQRLKALTELGVKKVPVKLIDVDETREKVINIRLNKVEGEWDFPKLKELLIELDTGAFDIEDTGFSLDQIENLIRDFQTIEPPEELFASLESSSIQLIIECKDDMELEGIAEILNANEIPYKVKGK